MSKRPGPGGILKPMPDLMPTATLLLELLVSGARVFEFGSGGSTLWLADHALEVFSMEDDADWYRAVKEMLPDPPRWAGLRLVKTSEIAGAIDGTGEWDVVFVDCHRSRRRKAILRGREHVKPGGWLVADDYNFPLVTKTINKLEQDGWDVTVLSGVKIHRARNVPVRTATAFCHKPT